MDKKIIQAGKTLKLKETMLKSSFFITAKNNELSKEN